MSDDLQIAGGTAGDVQTGRSGHPGMVHRQVQVVLHQYSSCMSKSTIDSSKHVAACNLTICCDLSTNALVKSAPVMLAPPKSVLYQRKHRFWVHKHVCALGNTRQTETEGEEYVQTL